jgi:hypothetical protein
MSLAAQFSAAAATAATYAKINTLSAELWRAHAAGLIDDDAAQATAEAIHARRRMIGARHSQEASKPLSGLPRRSPPRSPDREASIRRRRAAAASGALPSRLAAAFTLAEVAVLSVVAAEVRRAGSCCWPVDKIAAVAGVSRRVVQYAVRAAERAGLIAVKARPRPGMKSETNILRVISRDWIAWLRIGCRTAHPSNNKGFIGELFTSQSPAPIADRLAGGDISEKARRRSSDAPRGGMSRD